MVGILLLCSPVWEKDVIRFSEQFSVHQAIQGQLKLYFPPLPLKQGAFIVSSCAFASWAEAAKNTPVVGL